MTITLFTTSWCGYCIRLKRRLDEAAVSFTEVDLDDEPEHGARIEAATGGNRVVPSVDVGARLLVNPTFDAVMRAVAELDVVI